MNHNLAVYRPGDRVNAEDNHTNWQQHGLDERTAHGSSADSHHAVTSLVSTAEHANTEDSACRV
jgi:hypothetical protein